MIKEPACMENLLKCNPSATDEIDSFLADENNPLVQSFLKVVAKYGTPEEINAKAAEANNLDNLKKRLADMNSPYLADLEWLEKQRDSGAFVGMQEYTERVLGEGATPIENGPNAVILEISAFNFFPWLIDEAQRAIRERQIMPGRYIRVRNMEESMDDQGDLLAFAAAMQIIGATYVETLNTRGTDGSNVNMGEDTLAGHFAGIGMPNEQPLEWVDEYLRHYTTNGVRQVLHITQAQLLLGYWLNQLGIESEFKVSVWLAGHDSAYGAAYTFMMAKLMENKNGRTPLIGLNISNSVNAETIRQIAAIRDTFGYRDQIRIEHHLTQTYKSTVRQPYLRRDEILEVAATVANVAAKHEGADPDVEEKLNHQSDFFDYFRTKEDLESSGDMALMRQLYLEKHESVQTTADALTQAGIGFVTATNLHR